MLYCSSRSSQPHSHNTHHTAMLVAEHNQTADAFLVLQAQGQAKPPQSWETPSSLAFSHSLLSQLCLRGLGSPTPVSICNILIFLLSFRLPRATTAPKEVTPPAPAPYPPRPGPGRQPPPSCGASSFSLPGTSRPLIRCRASRSFRLPSPGSAADLHPCPRPPRSLSGGATPPGAPGRSIPADVAPRPGRLPGAWFGPARPPPSVIPAAPGPRSARSGRAGPLP